MDERTLREEMAALGQSLFNRGYSVGSGGNISAKLPDGAFLATPTGSSLGRLNPGKISHIAADGRLLSGDKPSKESQFHLKIYAARPECGAVVHLHSTYATALSACADLNIEDVIRPFTPYYVMQIGKLPLVRYYKPGSAELFAAIAEKAATASCLLLANHGQVATGKTLIEAVNRAEELEETARLLFILKAAAFPINYLSGAQIAQLRP